MFNQSINPDLKGYYHINLQTLASCFKKPSVSGYKDKKKIYEDRKLELIDYANSKQLALLCDCSDNLELEKIKEKIFKYINDGNLNI